MKNDEFDRRVHAFFAGAPRPAAPEALRRLPGTLVVPAPDRGRAQAPRVVRGRALAGIGTAGLAVVVLSVALLMRFPGGQAASTATATTAGSAASSTSPTASPTASPASVGSAYALDGLAWQEVGIGTFDGVESLSLFPIDQGLLVIGTSRTAQTRLWLSTDGVRLQPLDASAFASDLDPATYPVVVHGLVKGPAGYVAIGTQTIPAKTVYRGRITSPLVWRSADGLHWNRVEAQGLPGVGLASIATTSNGYVVAPEPTWTDTSITLHEAYFSTDGMSWQKTPVIVSDVVGRDGHVVALTSKSAVAVTDDGTTWTTLHPAKQVVRVEASPDGFIAIAYDQATTKMSVIRSSDGRSWTNAGATSANWANGMFYAMGRWVMFGASPGGPNPWPPILTSPDALSWQSSAIPNEVLRGAMPGGGIFPFQDGFFAEIQVEVGPGSVVAYGPLQVHLWWVRAARAGDTPGSTAPPEPSMEPVATPTGGISEARAIEIAGTRYPNTLTQPYGKLVPIGGFDPKQTLVSPDRPVWAVMVIVPKPGCSPLSSPGPSPCELPYSSLTVIVDYMTGDIIEVLDSNGSAVP